MAPGLPERGHGRARRFEIGPVLFGAYPEEREAWVEPALQSVVESHGGRSFHERPLSASGSRGSSRRATWDQPRPVGRWFEVSVWPDSNGDRAKICGVAIQGSVSRWGEVALLAFDPAEGARALLTSLALRTPSWCS